MGIMIKCMLFLLTITCIMENAKAIRDMPIQPGGLNLTARLETSGGLIIDCWNALTDIKSCLNQIVLFLINGQDSSIHNPLCCRAIETITQQCWPAMMASLGFTSEECNILSGFCDAHSGPAPSPLVQPPTAATSMVMV